MTGIDANDFEKLIVTPVLKDMGMHSQAAVRLMMCTAIYESKLTRLVQMGGGPALSFYQIELATAKDILQRYLELGTDRREDLRRRFNGAVGVPAEVSWLEFPDMDIAKNLIYDMGFATAVARLKYYMVPEALPGLDAAAIEWGSYYKRHYNTAQGKGRATDFAAVYKDYISKKRRK